MALVRVYCGLASADLATSPPPTETWLTVAVVDDAGRLLDICDISDDAAGYAELNALLAERSSGPASVAVAADTDGHIVTRLLTAAGRYLAYTDDNSADDYAERFADDESAEEIQSSAAERRAVGLARALQAGVLSAVPQATPRDMLSLKPVLTAHTAVIGGRQGAAATLREVLRELYPAALRAYPDPAEPVPLAVLEAIPEPGQLGTGTSATRNREAPVIAELVEAGVADPETVTEAVTALRVAIAETPRRTGMTRSVTSAVAETIRQAVASVRACDGAAAALVSVLADRMSTSSGPTARRPAARSRTAQAAPVVSAPPSSAPLRAVREPVEPAHRHNGRIPSQPSPLDVPAARAEMPPVPYEPPAARFDPPAARYEPPAAPVSAPPPAHHSHQPTIAAMFPSRHRSQQPPAPEVPLPAAAPLPPPVPPPAGPVPTFQPPTFPPQAYEPPPMPASYGPHTHEQPVFQPPTWDSAPPVPSPVSPAPVSSAPVSSAPVSPAAVAPVSPAQPQYRGGPPGDLDRYGTSLPSYANSGPAPGPSPDVSPPGSRADWPLVGDPLTDPVLDDRSVNPSVEVPRQREGRITPPWQADDLPAEPPTLRLVEPAPLADPALSSPPPPVEERRYDSAADLRIDPTPLLDPPPLRLVEPDGADRNGGRNGRGSRRAAPGFDRPTGLDGPTPEPTADESDGDLLIFAATRSAWFTDHDDSAETSWTSPMDQGWLAAEQAARPAVGAETTTGLPRRVPQQNLVPGSPINTPERPPLRIVRDAESIAAHTAGYFRGWRRGQEVGGYRVGGRPGRESAGGWDFSRDPEPEYRSAGRR